MPSAMSVQCTHQLSYDNSDVNKRCRKSRKWKRENIISAQYSINFDHAMLQFYHQRQEEKKTDINVLTRKLNDINL